MKTFITFNFGYCETMEERVQRLRDAGLTEEEIDKVILNLPKEVLDAAKSGKKLFTQEQVTKARHDERRRVEGNLRYSKKPTDDEIYEDDEDDNVQDPPAPRKKPKPKAPVIDKEELSTLIRETVQAETKTLKDENEALKARVAAEETARKEREQKAVEKHKATLVAKLPEKLQGKLRGNTIEELDESFELINSLIEEAKQEAQASAAATSTLSKNGGAFWKAADGTEFKTLQDIAGHTNKAYWTEYKQSLNKPIAK